MNDENIDHSLDIADLIADYLNGELSFERQETLLKWRSENEQNEALFRHICNEEHLNTVHKSFKNYDTTAALSKIYSQVEIEKKSSRFSYRMFARITTIAAAIVLVFGVYFFWGTKVTKDESLSQDSTVRPGKKLATLTLGDGTTVQLQGIASGKITEQANLSITKINDGLISYSNNVKADQSGVLAQQYKNTISTPRGGYYQILLADGTKVWLNAASSLTFSPELNREGRRTVELNGEAYFEVARNKDSPFEVYSSKVIAGKRVFQEVKVLGTHFNVNAYDDEPEMKTTLIEGAVQVSTGGSRGSHNATVMLMPGELATIRNENQILVSKVDASESIAWKNDLFIFNNESIGSIMRRISRWYNIDVVFEGVDQNRVFGGTVSRFDDVNEVLDMLSLTGTIHFETKDKKIIVKP